MADDNPILNNPYTEPNRHYATNLDGELDYSDIRPGRRIFTRDIFSIPLSQGLQQEVFEVKDATASHRYRSRTEGRFMIRACKDKILTTLQSGANFPTIIPLSSFGERAQDRLERGGPCLFPSGA